MSKHQTIDQQRREARADANALVKLCGGLNKAANEIGMNRGRMSFIVRGQWRNVAINDVDLAMLKTGRVIREHDIALTDEARGLARELQDKMSELHDINARLIKVLRKL